MKYATLALLLLLIASPSAASGQAPCSHETLSVLGTPVAVGYCVEASKPAGAGEVALIVAASYAGGGHTIARTTTMRFLTAEGPSRLLESIDLAPLGITGTLHLTLVYAGGLVRVESALLTPGAVIVK